MFTNSRALTEQQLFPQETPMFIAKNSYKAKIHTLGAGKKTNIKPASLPDIKRIIAIISIVAWINMLIGAASIIVYPLNWDFSLFSTGLLSVLTFIILKIRIKDTIHSGNWYDVCITAISGIYFPSYVMWISVINLYNSIIALS